MAERMLDLPIGGIDDMAVWTGFVWERIARWLDHGPPPNPEPRNPSEAAAITAAIAGEEEEDRGGAWMRRFLRLARASIGETRVPFCPPKATTLVLRKRQFATTGSGQAGRKLKTKGFRAVFDDRERVLRLLKASAAHPLPPFRWADTTDDDSSSASSSSSSSSSSSTDGDGDGDGDGGGKRLIFQGPAEAEEMMWATLHTLSAATRTPLPGPSAPSSTLSSSSFSSDSDSPAELTTAERAAAPAAAAAAAEVPPAAAASAPAPPPIASSNISLAYLGSAMAVGAKDAFFAPFYILKRILLPRQAWDRQT